MSDESVRAALRSNASLVVVEAAAGCGKTYQGADYARELAELSLRPLILTHTHAACSVFAERTKAYGSRVQIRTLDSLIAQIAKVYHLSLGLPEDIAAWVRQQEDGYAALANKVATFVTRNPIIPAALARHHHTVICDEHQDSSGDQHALIMALLHQGARLRVFGDPMQRIFPWHRLEGASPAYSWSNLRAQAQCSTMLDVPHRWKRGCPRLGEWTITARRILEAGGKLDLRSRPESVTVVFAENRAQQPLTYQLSQDDRPAIDCFAGESPSLLVLTRHNQIARSFRAFFNRRIPLWEGHSRDNLETLVKSIDKAQGDRRLIAAAIVTFINGVGKGFSPSSFGQIFEREVEECCTRKLRGKAAAIQEVAHLLVENPNHVGVAGVLRRLSELVETQPAFKAIKIDYQREFWDAIKLGTFETADTGLAEIMCRRTFARPKPPARAISTIHKAKGLECGSVIVMPCDSKTFPDNLESRCLLYVALTRATRRLLIVVSRGNPSPLIRI